MKVIPGAMALLTVVSLAAGPLGAAVIEDFEDGDLSDYAILSGSLSTLITSGASMHDGALGLLIDGEGWAVRDDAAVQVARGSTFYCWLNLGATPAGRAYFSFGASTTGALSLVAAPNTTELLIQRNANFDFQDLATSPQTWQANKWYRLEVIWDVTGSVTGNLYDSDGVTLLNTVAASDETITSGGIAFRGFNGSAKSFDTVTIPGGLSVTPLTDAASLGMEGGPFVPTDHVYTISNDGEDPFEYEISRNEDWLALDDGTGMSDGPLTGTLSPGESRAITVTFDEDAEGLPVGDYTDSVSFLDTTTGKDDTARPIRLRVLDVAAPQMLFNGDFEHGDFSGWRNTNFLIDDGTHDPPGPEPPQPTCQEESTALTSQSGSTTHTLVQEVTLLPGHDIVTLGWIDRISNYASDFASNQEFRVEIRDAGGAVLREVFSTSPGDPSFSPCTTRSVDISEFAEQTIRVAFVVDVQQGFFNVAVDDVQVVLGRSNQAPVADAGIDRDVECTGPAGAIVTLNGSGSSDADSTPETNDDIVLFEWFEDFGQPTETLLGTGEMLTTPFPLGSHAVTLRVTDTAGDSGTDVSGIGVVDTTPPSAYAHAFPIVLWPPNHRMMQVDIVVAAEDLCGGVTTVLSSVTSNEPDNGTGTGDGNTTDDIQGIALGTPDFDIELRAERAGSGEGRIYTVAYEAVDDSGNVAGSSDYVFVPHNQERVTEPVVVTVADKPGGLALEWSDVPGSLYYNVVRGNVSQIRELRDRIDLGDVICLKSRSIDPHTVGDEDAAIPAPGETFFYVVEYFDGFHSSHGTASASKPRHPGLGDCE